MIRGLSTNIFRYCFINYLQLEPRLCNQKSGVNIEKKKIFKDVRKISVRMYS